MRSGRKRGGWKPKRIRLQTVNAPEIHPQAVVAAGAKLGRGVRIAAHAVVGEGVVVGDGCSLHEYAVLRGPATVGRDNVFHSFCVVGGEPQDLKFHGEPTEVHIGDGNTLEVKFKLQPCYPVKSSY